MFLLGIHAQLHYWLDLGACLISFGLLDLAAPKKYLGGLPDFFLKDYIVHTSDLSQFIQCILPVISSVYYNLKRESRN